MHVDCALIARAAARLMKTVVRLCDAINVYIAWAVTPSVCMM
jgi:hypothetical protein